MTDKIELKPYEGVRKTPSLFVQKLVSERKQNDSTNLPEIPSAQLWHSMNESEKAEFKTVVEKVGKWEDFEKDMIACHPKSINKGAPTYKVRGAH